MNESKKHDTKTSHRKSSPQELWFVFLPYPLLWLMLGICYDPAVFTFWKPATSMGRLDAMAVGFIPITFSLIYLPAMYVIYRKGKPVTLTHTVVYGFIAFLVATVMVPIP